ncbi:MAG TPA: OsmC family protein, partial [Anaeromyxobacter sp.]
RRAGPRYIAAMSTYLATVEWRRGGAAFVDNRYARAHVWRFDGGAEVRASSSPQSVAAPLSDPAGVDPEEAFVAALSSCHMLWFLSIAAKRGLVVERYLDEAAGVMARNAAGKLAMTRVTLRPAVTFSGRAPGGEELRELHHLAHEECFIASSVRTEVVCEPVAS